MDASTIIGIVVVGMTTLLGLYVSVKNAFSKPIEDLTADLRVSQEQMRQALRGIEENQRGIKEINTKLVEHETRLAVLEHNKEKGND